MEIMLNSILNVRKEHQSCRDQLSTRYCLAASYTTSVFKALLH